MPTSRRSSARARRSHDDVGGAGGRDSLGDDGEFSGNVGGDVDDGGLVLVDVSSENGLRDGGLEETLHGALDGTSAKGWIVTGVG